MSDKFVQGKRGPLAKPKVWLLILLLLGNTIALVLVWEQPDCAGSMECHSTKTIPQYLLGSLPLLSGMSLLDRLNPLKSPWYKQDKWHKNRRFKCHEVVETHDCPAWDIRLVYVDEYKHKDSCQTRYRISHEETRVKDSSLTQFEDPTDRELEWKCVVGLGQTTEPLARYDVYDGPDYE